MYGMDNFLLMDRAKACGKVYAARTMCCFGSILDASIPVVRRGWNDPFGCVDP
jgi:hypothetical protein